MLSETFDTEFFDFDEVLCQMLKCRDGVLSKGDFEIKSSMSVFALVSSIISTAYIDKHFVCQISNLFAKHAERLGASESPWAKDALKAVEYNVRHDTGLDFWEVIVKIMRRIDSRGDLVALYDKRPKKAFDFISTLLTLIELDYEKIPVVFKTYKSLAIFFGFTEGVMYSRTERSLLSRVDQKTSNKVFATA